MADSTLAAIRTKVRRLTQSPSESQITDLEINEYINTFILYDFPEHLRLMPMEETLTFYTKPNISTYETSTTLGDPLYNFKNVYITTHNPVLVGGVQVKFTQSLSEFTALYPNIPVTDTIAVGDGFSVAYTGTLSPVGTPILIGSTLFSSINGINTPLTAYDSGIGTLSGDAIGTLDYLTGAYSLLFSSAPKAGENIYSSVVQYTPGTPQAILFYNSKFTLRPIPDKAYAVTLKVYKRPTALLDDAQSPQLEQWWQYIAYGAAKKIFEDRADMDSVQTILPEFKTQESLVLRTTLVQQAKQCAPTIYSSGTIEFY